MNIFRQGLNSPDTAVVRMGQIAGPGSSTPGFNTQYLHIGDRVAPHMSDLREEGGDFAGIRRQAGNVILGSYYSCSNPLVLPSSNPESHIGSALVVAERIDMFVIVSLVHADNRRESRPGAVNRVSFVGTNHTEAEPILDGIFRGLQSRVSIGELNEELGEEYVPAALQIGMVAVYDEKNRRYVTS